jgi:hypothetical protein
VAEVSGLTTVDKLIRKLLFKKGKGNEDYLQYLAIIADGVQDLNFHHIGLVKSVAVEVADDSISFPFDYVNYVSLSVDDGRGRMWTFTRDDEITIKHADFVDESVYLTAYGGEDYISYDDKFYVGYE